MDIGPAELIIVLLVVLVLFGGAKLPQLARSLGQAQTEFKRGRQEGLRSDRAGVGDDDENKDEAEAADRDGTTDPPPTEPPTS
jgi:sec-independent protein translocase protein TatA